MDLQTWVLYSHYLYAGAVFVSVHTKATCTQKEICWTVFYNASGETGVFRPYFLFVPVQESTDYLDRGTTTNFSRKGPSTIAKIKEALNFMRNQLFEVKAAHIFTVKSIYLFILYSVNLIFHITF